jgi:hypothetical protein
MKVDQLVNLIDKLVEKKLNIKIRQIIKEEISSEINKAMGKILVEMVKEVKKMPITEEIHKEEKPLQSPINTSNLKLNSALAETAKNFKPLQKTSDASLSLVELMDGGFDKIGEKNISYSGQQPKIEPDGTNIGFLKSMITEGTSAGQSQSILGTDAVPDVLKNIFFKKAKDVMKKMDEQKKHGTMGMIDPRSVLSD